MFDPWTFILRQLPRLTVSCVDLSTQGIVGYTDGRSIVLHRGLSQRAARSTLTHELLHLFRGLPPPVPGAEAREEELVERESAKLLIELRLLAEAMVITGGVPHDGAAEELDVDLTTLRARIRACSPADIAWISARIENIP